MPTQKITQKQLEEMVREMVTKMVNEMPGEAPIMEKKLTQDEKKMKERLVKGLKKKYGKTPKTYAIATDLAKKLAEEESGEDVSGYTDKYDDSPFLKGKQKTGLPDKIQALIHNSKGGKKKDEEIEERNMSAAWGRSAASPKPTKDKFKKGLHSLEEEKIAELERKKRNIIKQLEELNFGSPQLDEPEIETDTDEETYTTTPPRPGRPNPFRREEDDTQVIPDLEPQGNLKDVIKRYLNLKK
jgi:hypothetical protein